ncbi:MAG: hypothetical protein AAFW76_04150 [Pseudomonadota bacterium]
MRRSKTAKLAALSAIVVLAASSHAFAQETSLDGFSIGTSATDLSGFRLKDSFGVTSDLMLGARLTDQIGGTSGRAIVDLSLPDSGVRFSFGMQLELEETTSFGPVQRDLPLSFGSEQYGQATPYIGFGYVGRISDRFEISLDAGANYLGSDDISSGSSANEIDRSGSVFGWSPTVSFTGRVRF